MAMGKTEWMRGFQTNDMRAEVKMKMKRRVIVCDEEDEMVRSRRMSAQEWKRSSSRPRASQPGCFSVSG